MNYISTRGESPAVCFRDAVLTGLADDGGLILPAEIPDVTSELDAWRELSYAELACRVFAHFVDVPEADLHALVAGSYATFDREEVTPVVELGDFHLLELFHGPTLAFKDVALQFLGNLFEYFLGQTGGHLNILGATSGDTGSAAICGVRGKARMRIFVMFPRGRTSRVQELQMTSVLDPNVHCIAIEGSFDDCQSILKECFGDAAFKAEYALGAVNSVNWARVLAQIVYYFYGAFRVMERTGSDSVAFAVPTGNFGDIFAGWMAVQMGLPCERLILATNENDILARFFNSGDYSLGEVVSTISPSMDIQVASNFERYLYYRVGGDSERLRAAMNEFRGTGRLTSFDSSEERLVVAGRGDTEHTLATIRDVHDRSGYVIDPHTAVGVCVGRELRAEGMPLICLATAHPSKFPEAIRDATGREDLGRHPAVDALVGARTRCDVLPASVDAVKRFIEQRAG